MASAIPTRKLNNGVDIPLLGFGTFAKGRIAGESYDAVTVALQSGYRHLDCAWFYNNEDEIGAALKDWLAVNPAHRRSDIFITSKVWPHLCGSPEDIEWSLDQSLQMLQTDYLDCFLIHFPVAAERTLNHEPKKGSDGKYIIRRDLTEHPERIWPTMEKLYKAGKARSIGVSNWSVDRLEILLSRAEIKPVINQIEIHPFLPNSELVEFCFLNDILPVCAMAYSPLGSQHEIPITRERLTTNPALTALAERTGMTVAQILIAWGLKRGYGVLPKSSTAERIRRNIQLMELNEQDFKAVSQITGGRSHRFCDLEYMFGYDIWKC